MFALVGRSCRAYAALIVLASSVVATEYLSEMSSHEIHGRMELLTHLS